MPGRNRLIHRSPVHLGFSELIANDKFVLGRAARELAGAHHQRPVVRQQPLAAGYGVLDELLRAAIVKRSTSGPESGLGFVECSRTTFLPEKVGRHLLLS